MTESVPHTTAPAPAPATALAAQDSSGLGFHLRVPSSWYEFDIHPAVRDDNIRRAVRERVRERPELAGSERDLTKALRRLCRDAWHGGVLYCGFLAEVLDDAPLLANLTVAVVRARGDDGALLTTAPAGIAASLTPVAKGRRPTDVWREVSVVTLPEAGEAARTAGIEDIELPGDDRMARMVMMQTFVPVPGFDDRVAVITGSTPQLELAEPMLDLFDAVTSNFSFVPSRSER